MNKVIFEYIWIGGNGELRSKTRVLNNIVFDMNLSNVPEWNYDGYYTNQMNDNKNNTKVILKPKFVCNDPIRIINGCECYLVLCDNYDIDGNPLSGNERVDAVKRFEEKLDEYPLFGLEQEYFMIKNSWNYHVKQGEYYCGTRNGIIPRKIVEEHLKACIQSGLLISGINAEVATFQWKFKIGPCFGIIAADQLYMSRYLLERIADKYDVLISYKPKCFEDLNGSGCHTNFSTFKMRENGGINEIYDCMEKLRMTHKKYMIEENYGIDNHLRLTSIHETENYKKFSFGIGTRNTSISISNQTVKDSCGYFEDRRPAANMNPYLVTSLIFETCCLEKDLDVELD